MDEIFNLKSFHESTTEELMAVRNRVRNLIGDSHWGEDGRFKEDILRDMIKRFISPRYTVGTGFIVKNNHDNIKCTSQIDILIFDSNYPTLFSNNDFYVVTPNCVRAVIEVKTNFQKNPMWKTIKTVNELGSFLDETQTDNLKPFVGIFSFEGSNPRENTIRDHINRGIGNKCFINHISLNKDIFIKLWQNEWIEYLSIYDLKDLSFSFFISNLIQVINDENINAELPEWFAMDKERKLLFDIEMEQEHHE